MYRMLFRILDVLCGNDAIMEIKFSSLHVKMLLPSRWQRHLIFRPPHTIDTDLMHHLAEMN